MTPHPPSTDPAGLLGRSLDGRYQATAFLGEGELGFVYQAEQTTLRRPCALKILRPEIQRDPERLQRVLQGSQRLTRMRLDAFVRPDDVVLSADETVLVLPLLVGASVGALLRRHRGPLPWVHARDLLLQVGAALARLHAAGLACGGLKPSNVFVVRGSDGAPQVWLLDAMLSRHEPRAASVAYMAPECNGAAPDPRSDIYSFGALAHELLTAQPVFAGAPAQLVVMHRVKPARPLRIVAPDIVLPPGVESIVLRALEKDPQARPDIDALLAVLRASTEARDNTDVLSIILPPGDSPTLAVARAGASAASMSFRPGYDAAPEDGATQMFRRQPLPARASRSGELPDDGRQDSTHRSHAAPAAHSFNPAAEHTRAALWPGRAPPPEHTPPTEHTRVAIQPAHATPPTEPNPSTPAPVEHTRVANPPLGRATPMLAEPHRAPAPAERTLALTPQVSDRTLEFVVPGVAPRDPGEPSDERTMVLAMNPPSQASSHPDPGGQTSRTQIIPGFGGAVLDPGFVPANAGTSHRAPGGRPSHHPSLWHRMTRALARFGPARASRPGWWARFRRAPSGNLPARRGQSSVDRVLRGLATVPGLIGRGWRHATRPLGRLYSLRGKLASPMAALRSSYGRVKRALSRWTGSDGV